MNWIARHGGRSQPVTLRAAQQRDPYGGPARIAYRHGRGAPGRRVRLQAVRLVSRNNKPLNYLQLLDALKKLPVDRVILDGEIAALDQNGRSSFQLLQDFKSSEGVPLVYFVCFG